MHVDSSKKHVSSSNDTTNTTTHSTSDSAISATAAELVDGTLYVVMLSISYKAVTTVSS